MRKLNPLLFQLCPEPNHLAPVDSIFFIFEHEFLSLLSHVITSVLKTGKLIFNDYEVFSNVFIRHEVVYMLDLHFLDVRSVIFKSEIFFRKL